MTTEPLDHFFFSSLKSQQKLTCEIRTVFMAADKITGAIITPGARYLQSRVRFSTLLFFLFSYLIRWDEAI